MDEFKAWLSSPFQADMPASHWFFFVGLLLAIFIAWGMIFRHIQGEF